MSRSDAGREPRFLTLTDLLRLVDDLGVGPVRDVGLLQSAVARPATRLYGRWAYETVAEQAAALMHSIVRNHALVDGNKRLGLLACLVMLHLNGCETKLGNDEMYDLVVSASVGALEVAELAERLRVRVQVIRR